MQFRIFEVIWLVKRLYVPKHPSPSASEPQPMNFRHYGRFSLTNFTAICISSRSGANPDGPCTLLINKDVSDSNMFRAILLTR